jgi:hypothetical protein
VDRLAVPADLLETPEAACNAPDPGPPPPTLAEMMRSFLAQLEAGTLNAEAKARMEMVMLQCWRDELALHR